MDRQMDKWTKYGQTNRWNYKKQKQKMSTDVRHTNLIGGLVTRNPPKNEIAYFSSNVPKKAFLDFKVAFKLTWVAAKT